MYNSVRLSNRASILNIISYVNFIFGINKSHNPWYFSVFLFWVGIHFVLLRAFICNRPPRSTFLHQCGYGRRHWGIYLKVYLKSILRSLLWAHLTYWLVITLNIIGWLCTYTQCICFHSFILISEHCVCQHFHVIIYFIELIYPKCYNQWIWYQQLKTQSPL